jgi:hypothetical protein
MPSMGKRGKKIKVQFKINKTVFTDFIIKEMCVQKTFCRTQFEYHRRRAYHIHTWITKHLSV